jgi:hypothetical protein
MSLLDSVLGDTVGTLWSAASGTVDPWTKQSLIDDEASELVQASGGNVSLQDATAEAQNDVTAGLSQTSDGVSADPSNFWGAIAPNLKRNLVNLTSGISDQIKNLTGFNLGPLLLVVLGLAIMAAIFYVLFLTPVGARIVE